MFFFIPDKAYREPAGGVVVVPLKENIAVEEQVARVIRIVRRGRPVVAEVARIVDFRAPAAARSGQEHRTRFLHLLPLA